MQLPVLVLQFLLLAELSLEQLDEQRLEEDLMQGDEDLDDQQDDLRLRKDKPNAVFDLQVLGQHLAPVQLDEVQQFSVDDGELLADELFEEEDVPVLVDVVEPVDVGTQSSADLPAVGLAESLEAVGVGMQVL